MENNVDTVQANADVTSINCITVYENADSSGKPSVLAPLQNNESCDIELYGKPLPGENADYLRPIKGHQTILAAASSRLDKLFQSNNVKNSNVYKVEQVSHTSLATAVDFIYTRKLRFVWACDNSEPNKRMRIENALIAADYLLMPEMVEFCGKLLAKDLSHWNVDFTIVETWQFARKYHCSTLAKAALDVMTRNVDAVCNGFSFYSNLDANDLLHLISVFISASVAPDLICSAAINWLRESDELELSSSLEVDCDMLLKAVPLERMALSSLNAAIKEQFLPEGWQSKLIHVRSMILCRTTLIPELDSRKRKRK